MQEGLSFLVVECAGRPIPEGPESMSLSHAQGKCAVVGIQVVFTLWLAQHAHSYTLTTNP